MSPLRKLIVSGIALSLLGGVPVSAGGVDEEDKGFYTTLGVGFVEVDDVEYGNNNSKNMDTGFSGEAGLGYRFNEKFRAELTYGYNKVYMDDGFASIDHAATHSGLITGYYDITNDSKWTPYIGAGIGYAKVDTDANTEEDDDATTYQFKLGVTYNQSENIDLFGELGYQVVGETEIGNKDVEEITMLRAQMGVRYNF